jgi:hypothetical protein
MHGVAAAVGAWLDAGEDPVVVRVPLAEGIGGAGPGEVLAFGSAGKRAGGLLGGAVDAVAARLAAEVRATGLRQVESVQITNQVAAAHGLTCDGEGPRCRPGTRGPRPRWDHRRRGGPGDLRRGARGAQRAAAPVTPGHIRADPPMTSAMVSSRLEEP